MLNAILHMCSYMIEIRQNPTIRGYIYIYGLTRQTSIGSWGMTQSNVARSPLFLKMFPLQLILVYFAARPGGDLNIMQVWLLFC